MLELIKEKLIIGERLVWKRGREYIQNEASSSSGKFETADKTSGHVSSFNFNLKLKPGRSGREGHPNNREIIQPNQSNFCIQMYRTIPIRSKIHWDGL